MVGFVNALAIMIFTSQFPYLFGQSWPAYAMTVGALVIIYGLPLIIRSIPSTFTAGAFLIVLIIGLRDYVVQIPMAALVAVMIMVSIGTFDWQSLKTLPITPKSDAFVMRYRCYNLKKESKVASAPREDETGEG